MNWPSRSRVAFSRATRRGSKWRKAVPMLGVVAALLVLAATAVVIARGDATEDIARDAQVLTWAESVTTATAVLRGEIREGLVVGQGAALGVFDANDTAGSASAIRDTAAEVALRAATLSELTGDTGLVGAAGDMVAYSDALAEHLVVGDVEAALEIAEGDLATAFEDVAALTTVLSQRAADNISVVSAGVGTITTAARFVSAMLIPIVAIYLLYRALRKSQRISLLRSELSRERELRRKKDAFLAAASHHIRTPLAAVVGFAALLRDRSRDFNAGVRHEVTELLALEAEETSNVVDDLLAAARHDLGDIEIIEEEIDVRDLLDAATSDWLSKQRMRLSITGNATVVGDRAWLAQAVRNLLRNAVSFGGEQITVDVRPVMNRVVISISDNGDAIPAEEHDRIFELHYTYRQIEGLAPTLGLGLAVAQRVARAMGGDLTYSRLDDLNVFKLNLRRAEASPRAGVASTITLDPNEGMPTLASMTEVIVDGGPDVAYQPIVDLPGRRGGSQQVVGYEALARFDSLTPSDWLYAASRLGLRTELELSCISKAISTFDPPEDGAFLAVNLSDRTLQTTQLHDAMQGIDPKRLVLELSETASIKSYEETKRVVDALSARGVRLAIDDVGAGEIDLWHIARLGTHLVKLDMSLVRDIDHLPRNRALVRAIVGMADELGIVVVAEGVETESEHSELVDLGVRFGQGHLYSRPTMLGASLTDNARYRAS